MATTSSGSTKRGRGKSDKNLALIATARDILAEIHPASVRAVGYQLLRPYHLIPDMKRGSSKRVSEQLTWAREHEEIPWDWIVDEVRGAEGHPGWEDPEAFAAAAGAQYRRDRWLDQDCRVEVWSEKGTVRGTLWPILSQYGVQFRVMHGFGSATEVHGVAELVSAPWAPPLIVLYVGDFDPSGLYMSEVDLPGRLTKYGAALGQDLDLRRIALTTRDTEALGRPFAFAAEEKRNDARYPWFVARYGAWCWELDALKPTVLRARVEAEINACITDRAAWERAERVQETERESLVEMLTRWTDTLNSAAGGA